MKRPTAACQGYIICFKGELIGVCGPTPVYRFLFLACQMQAVGITSELTIPSRSLSATSSRSGFEPDKGRLHGDGAWSPSDNGNPYDYLQIDLQYDFFICAVATQGHPSSDLWTTKYKLLFSVDDINWLTYKEKGKDKVCIAITTHLIHFSVPESGDTAIRLI